MARMGWFRIKYDPDEAIPLPRPFRLEGEGKTKDPVPLKAPAKPKRPDIPSAREKSPLRLYPRAWLQRAPHKRKAEVRHNGIKVWKLSRQEARQATGDSKAKGGVYVVIDTGEKKWVRQGTRMVLVPKYRFKRMPDNVERAFLYADKDPIYAQDPQRLEVALKYLWRHGLKERYFSLYKYGRMLTLRLREEARDNWAEWAREWNAEKARREQEYRESVTWWQTS